MNGKKYERRFQGIIGFIVICLLLIPSLQATVFPSHEIRILHPVSTDETGPTNEVEYWALLVAVGIYRDNPSMDRPTMLQEIKRFESLLPVTSHWDEDHIKIITEEDATVTNILKGLRWLDDQEDENDICLIYLTTHGFPLWFDRPPFDEADGRDEALASYTGFFPFNPIDPDRWEPMTNPFGIITDDQLNRCFNNLESSGVAVIVDSCHSGGFDDDWSYGFDDLKQSYVYDFASELQGQNRIVVTSVPEEDVSYGSYFSHYLIDGMKGFADNNNDGKVTMEEAFYYAEEIITDSTSMRPQIFDNYPGELILTEKQLPPSITYEQGIHVGSINDEHEFSFVVNDPENERVHIMIDWDDGTPVEWSEETYESGETIELTHQWNMENTYNVMMKAKDQHQVESDWINPAVVTIVDDYHQVDQRQVKSDGGWLINNTRWCAQSFIPTLSTIDTIGLEVIAWEEGDEFTLSIRENLSGPDILSKTMQPDVIPDWSSTQWLSFQFDETTVVPGNTYYIVLKGSETGRRLAWFTQSDDPYEHGDFYYTTKAGTTWLKDTRYHSDATFITYGN